MLNVVCTSKPSDGLLYYSYEYAALLHADLVIVTHPDFTDQDYLDNISKKYVECGVKVHFNDYDNDCPSLLMGRSMITLPYLNRNSYNPDQLILMTELFQKAIVFYAENHSFQDYQTARFFFRAMNTVDVCDYDVYPNGSGFHCTKEINFDIHKPIEEEVEYEYLFMGTNERYYKASLQAIEDKAQSAILVYPNAPYIDSSYNHVFAPVDNLVGKFNTYVYTKDYFDPAPRLIREFQRAGKQVLNKRAVDLKDGGYVYLTREYRKPNIVPIYRALTKLTGVYSSGYNPADQVPFRKTASVNIDISNSCPLLCPECPRQVTPSNRRRGGRMELSDFTKVINHFTNINFCGQRSDPIHHPEFIEMLKMCSDARLPDVSVHTASSHKSEEWFIEAFKACPKAVWWFGIDGWPEDSPKYRVNQDGRKLYNIMLLAREYLDSPPRWQCIRFNYNEHYVDELIEHARTLGIDCTIIDSDRWEAVEWMKPTKTLPKK